MRTDLELTRGDSYSLTLSLKNNEGEQIRLADGDIVYFTVKTSTETTNILFQKILTNFNELGECIIDILPSDTKEQRCKEYVYDIQVNFNNGKVLTVVRPSLFKVLEEVTYD